MEGKQVLREGNGIIIVRALLHLLYKGMTPKESDNRSVFNDDDHHLCRG